MQSLGKLRMKWAGRNRNCDFVEGRVCTKFIIGRFHDEGMKAWVRTLSIE